MSGIRLEYFDWGGRGEAIVLVPGRCQTANIFGDLAPLLATRFRVLGLTPRGCGRSEPAADGYGVDRQIDELVGFLDAMGIGKASFAGHSSGGGKVIRLAKRYPDRVNRLVTFDVIYSAVPDEYDARMEAAIAAKVAAGAQTPTLTLASHRATFQAWELGAWSSALELEFQANTEVHADGKLKYRRELPAWNTDFAEDVRQGRYSEAHIEKPALFLLARDLDINRVRRLPPARQRELMPMARAIGRDRRKQIAAYQRNGPHVRVKWLSGVSHYLFVDQPQKTADEVVRFLSSASDEGEGRGLGHSLAVGVRFR